MYITKCLYYLDLVIIPAISLYDSLPLKENVPPETFLSYQLFTRYELKLRQLSTIPAFSRSCAAASDDCIVSKETVILRSCCPCCTLSDTVSADDVSADITSADVTSADAASADVASADAASPYACVVLWLLRIASIADVGWTDEGCAAFSEAVLLPLKELDIVTIINVTTIPVPNPRK